VLPFRILVLSVIFVRDTLEIFCEFYHRFEALLIYPFNLSSIIYTLPEVIFVSLRLLEDFKLTEHSVLGPLGRSF
jgi:hypothetical protein